MVRTLTRPPPPASRRSDMAESSRLSRGCETVLDLAVLALATWTVVYHGCLVLGLGVWWAVVLEAAALVTCAVGRSPSLRPPVPRVHARLASLPVRARMPRLVRARPPRLRVRAPDPLVSGVGAEVAASTSRSEQVAVATAVASGATAVACIALSVMWPLAAAFWLVAACSGTTLAVLRARGAADPGPAMSPRDSVRAWYASTDVVIALAWTVALAALSLFTRRANPDDLYYVNLSQWVVDHATFPLRDTVFSDLVFPMSSWPPVASYDGLVGTIALLAGVRAASVAYLVVPPVATALSVLALWRLVRHWRVAATGLALSLALVFLLFDGGPGYAAPGSLFLTRIWQGKVILLCLMIPTLLVYALRYVGQPTGTRARWLFAGGVAAVGLSTSAMFLVPLIALAGAAPLVPRRPRRAVLGFAAMAAYPLAAGLVTLVVGGRSADLFGSRMLFRFDPAWFGPEVFRHGPVAVVAVTAVLAGALLIPHAAARVTTGVLTVIVGVTFVPGVTHAAFELVGLGPTLWRVSWIVPIAALVGVLGVLGVLGVRLYCGGRRGVMVAVAGVVGAVLVVSGVPIWSHDNGIELDRSPQWKLPPQAVVSAERAIAVARPGDLVLAPPKLSVTMAVLTTRVKTVAPRDYFMDYLRDDPRFDYPARQTLQRFVSDDAAFGDRADVIRALRVLGVDQVCLPTGSRLQTSVVRAAGYQLAASSPTDRCFRRHPPSVARQHANQPVLIGHPMAALLVHLVDCTTADVGPQPARARPLLRRPRSTSRIRIP